MNFLKTHYSAIIISAVVGLLIIGPQLFLIKSLGDEYQGVYMMSADAEMHYVARMQEIYDGNGLGNPYVKEYKNNVPSALFTISETILALPGMILGISAPTLNLLYKFFLPAIIMLLVYALMFRLTRNRFWSIATSIFVLLGHSLLNLPDILNFLRGDLVYTGFAMYDRPVNPELSSIFFFIFLILLYEIWQSQKTKWFVYLGLIFGASFYIYFYSFTFFTALIFVSIISALILKDWRTAKGLSMVLVSGIILGIPSLLNLKNLLNHSLYKDLAESFNVTASHLPIVSMAGIITSVIFLAYLYFSRQKSNLDNRFLVILIATAFVVINQQIITGIMLQEGHYHWYFNTPIFIIILMYVLYQVVSNLKKAVYILAILISLVAISSTVFIQYSSYIKNKDWAVADQNLIPALNWLKQNTPKESVVLANNKLSSLIPVFTSDNVFWEEHAGYYLLPKSRVEIGKELNSGSGAVKDAVSQYQIDYVLYEKSFDHFDLKGVKNKLVYEDERVLIYEI